LNHTETELARGMIAQVAASDAAAIARRSSNGPQEGQRKS
jgi:hypothetical protein